MIKTKLLFICSNNLSRSPTAEELFEDSDEYEARSAGTHQSARKVVTQELIDWADIIFVMSEKNDRHLTHLDENFDMTGKVVHDLDISDFIYVRNDPVLVKLLKEKLAGYGVDAKAP